jgi:hypothetical protein
MLSTHFRKLMTDPRNIAHDKKVTQEKKHHGEGVVQGMSETPQPGKKPHMQEHASDHVPPQNPTPDAEKPGGEN